MAAKLGDKSQVTVENVLGEIRTQENSTAIYAIKEENGSKGLINETTGTSSFPASYLFPKETTGIGTGVRIDVDENLSIVSAGATEVEDVEEVVAEIELSKAVINLTLKWSNGKPKVGYNATLGTGSSLQYMIGKDGTWKDLSGTSGTISDSDITLGKTVYVVATANGKQSQASSVKIKDEEKPTVSIEVTETTTDSITVQVTATDKKSGMPSTPKYTYYLDDAEVSTNNISDTYTFENLNSDTTYTIKVTTTDNAGNVGTAITVEKTDLLMSGDSNGDDEEYEDDGGPLQCEFSPYFEGMLSKEISLSCSYIYYTPYYSNSSEYDSDVDQGNMEYSGVYRRNDDDYTNFDLVGFCTVSGTGVLDNCVDSDTYSKWCSDFKKLYVYWDEDNVFMDAGTFGQVKKRTGLYDNWEFDATGRIYAVRLGMEITGVKKAGIKALSDLMGGFEAIFLPSAIEDIEEGSFDSDCVGTRFKTVYAETEEVAELVRKSGFNGNIMPLDYGGFTYYYRRSFLPWSYYNADMGS